MTNLITSEGPDADLVGTVRQEVDTNYTALWVKVNRAFVSRREFQVASEWMCIESSKVGLQGLVRQPEAVKDFPVVGFVPGSAAFERVSAVFEQEHAEIFNGFWKGQVSI